MLEAAFNQGGKMAPKALGGASRQIISRVLAILGIREMESREWSEMKSFSIDAAVNITARETSNSLGVEMLLVWVWSVGYRK